MDGVLTPGMLVAFGTLYAAFLAPLSHLARLDGSLQDMLNSIRRLEDVLHYPEAAEAGAGEAVAPSAARLSGTLELREVSFGYSPMEPPLIDRLSLTIQPGKRVALVGGSGSGKSTVAKLVAGLYEPWSGEILIDGRARGAIPAPVIDPLAGAGRSGRRVVCRHRAREPDAVEHAHRRGRARTAPCTTPACSTRSWRDRAATTR